MWIPCVFTADALRGKVICQGNTDTDMKTGVKSCLASTPVLPVNNSYPLLDSTFSSTFSSSKMALGWVGYIRTFLCLWHLPFQCWNVYAENKMLCVQT